MLTHQPLEDSERSLMIGLGLCVLARRVMHTTQAHVRGGQVFLVVGALRVQGLVG